METLTATELDQRCSQEGIQYTLEYYYDKKEFYTIKDDKLRARTLQLIDALKNFQDALEEAKWKELIDEN